MSESETVVAPQSNENNLLVNFFREIRTRIPKQELEMHFWVTKKGVFIREEYAQKITPVFCAWFQETIGSQMPVEKASRKLFGDSAEFYIIQGSAVVVGFVAECPTNELRGAGIRLYGGIPIDTTTSLHHTDPIFTEAPGLRCVLSKNGYEAVIDSKQGEFRVSFEIAARLRAWLSETGEMRKYLDSSSVRRFVESLKRSLNYSKRAGRRWHILIPARIISDKNLELLALGSIYVSHKAGEISDFFASKGRALQEMIRSELLLLTEDPKSKSIAGSGIQKVKGSFLATKDVAGLPHTFGVSAVQSFLEQASNFADRNRGRLPGKMELNHSVRECVLEISKLLNDAEPILPSKVPGKVLTDLPNSYALLQAKSEWYFGVDNHKMIRQVLYSPRQPKKEISLILKTPTSEHS